MQKSKIVNRKSKISGVFMPKAAPKNVQKPVEELTYEEALAELEEIVMALEGEQNQLEAALQLFERGQALASRCGVLLEAAELKVKQVAGDDILPFEEESE
jgi:exodeoxyribonuclease VII small subunit